MYQFRCVSHQLKQNAAQLPSQSVFLVGGFSASTWLFEKVRERIEPLGLTVSRPDAHV